MEKAVQRYTYRSGLPSTHKSKYEPKLDFEQRVPRGRALSALRIGGSIAANLASEPVALSSWIVWRLVFGHSSRPLIDQGYETPTRDVLVNADDSLRCFFQPEFVTDK